MSGSLRLALRPGYRSADALAFHGRDPQSPAEQVAGDTLHKALWVGDRPAVLELRVREAGAEARLAGGGTAPRPVVQRLLGLAADITPFEQGMASDPLLGPLIAARPGLRVLLTATPFEALVWAILGQQITLALAFRLRQRVIRRYGTAVGDLWAHPRPQDLVGADPEELGALKLSRAKAACLIAVSRAVASGDLPLDEVARLLAPYAPHRSLATFHLWASLKGTPA